MGGYDIFKSVYKAENDSWNDPVNLGYPINTPDDDIFVVSTKDGKRGYFATVRNDGVGYLDIYMVEIPDQTEQLADKLNKKSGKQLTDEGGLANRNLGKVNQQESNPLQPVQLLLKVEDATTQQALDAKVSLKGGDQNETLTSQKVAEGIYRFDIQNNQTVEYVLAVEKSGYIYKNVKVSIPPMANKPQEFRKKVTLDPVKQVATDYRMVLDFVYFDFDSVRLFVDCQDASNRQKSFLEVYS